MREVMIMKEMKGGEIQNLEEHSCRMRYLLGRFISYGGDRAVREMAERLLQEPVRAVKWFTESNPKTKM